MKSITFPVQGMTCPNCVRHVTKALEGVAGVARVAVSLAESRATVDFDPGRATEAALQAAVVDAGYSVPGGASADGEASGDDDDEPPGPPPGEDESATSVLLRIDGMHCANCALTIEKQVRRVPGVEDVSVNFARERARVRFRPSQTGPEPIARAIREAGYGSRPATEAVEHESGWRREGVLVAIAAAGTAGVLVAERYTGAVALGIALALSLAVLLTAGAAVYRGAWKSLRNGSANMDVLVALGATAAFVHSLVLMTGEHAAHQHAASCGFSTTPMLLLFIRTGKLLEAIARGRAGKALEALLKQGADKALVLVEGREMERPASEVRRGDTVVVRPGARLPVDGTVLEGATAVDESFLTGESAPVDKGPGDTVVAGSVNTSGRIVVRADAVGEETVLAEVGRLVEEAQADRPPVQRFADRLSAWFVPVVVVIAVLTFALSWMLGIERSTAAIRAIAVLVIACPCALGLATPTAILVSSGLALRRGILVRRGTALEVAAKLDAVVFDKTGTLTRGEPRLTAIRTLGGLDDSAALALAAALESGSDHPLARALVAEAAQRGLTLPVVRDMTEESGLGVRAMADGAACLIGRMELLENHGLSVDAARGIVEELDAQGMTTAGLARDGAVVAVFGWRDTVKDNAAAVIARLKELGLEPSVVSGDREAAVRQVCAELGIDRYHAGSLPQDKAGLVEAARSRGRVVAFVGDGINDAAALAAADVGIAIGSGSDVARETGDIVLVRNDLKDVLRTVTLGRVTLRKVKQNLFWALIYNVVGIPAAAGLFGFTLPPQYAGLAMSLSSVCVVTNALTLPWSWRDRT